MHGSRSQRYLEQVENGRFRSNFHANFHNKATKFWSGAKVNSGANHSHSTQLGLDTWHATLHISAPSKQNGLQSQQPLGMNRVLLLLHHDLFLLPFLCSKPGPTR